MARQQALRWLASLALLALLMAGCGNGQTEPTATPTSIPPTQPSMTRLDGKRVLFVVPDRFWNSEYAVPRSILEDLGALITVASWSLDPVLGSSGDTLQPEMELCDVHAEDYDGIVFVGGGGVHPTEEQVQRVVREAVDEGKVLAAICAAQGILKYAGLVEDSFADRCGVERDGLLITAPGPLDAREFGETIAIALGE